MGTKHVIVAGNSREEVAANVSVQGGIVGLQLSAGIYAMIVPDTYEDTSTQLEPPHTVKEVVEYVPSATELWLDGLSDLEVGAWEAFKKLEVIKVERPVSFTKRGKIAVALLMVDAEAEHHKLTDEHISYEVLPSLWQGAESLKLSYPDSELDIEFKPYYVTLSAGSQVPHVGLTSWPSAVPFRNKLYVFYQGNRCMQKHTSFNVFDPTTGAWEGITEVPSTTITDGPSAVVYNNHLYLFHSGYSSRHEVWYNVFDGTSWAGDARIDNTRITGGPSAVVYDGKIYCFHQAYTEDNNELWYNVYDGTKWLGDTLVVNTQITESPSAVVFKDKIYCFYQGLGKTENKLLLNRFDPEAEEWSGQVAVPYTNSTTKGPPSALVFEDQIYLFHQSGDHGELWFNTSTDGSLWRGDTPLTYEMSTEGVGTTVFQDKLYCFFQGVDKNFEALMYRSFAKGSLEWEDVWSLPALKSLGYESFEELAEAVRLQLHADYGYVACVTKLPLLYDSYADETRLCMNPFNDMATTFAKIFDATGVHDVSTDPTTADPRYTFALTSAFNNSGPMPITSYATGFVFHQGLGTDSGKRLWFSFLDRRSANWTEMQGPVTSLTTGGHAGVFLSYEKLYVFYQVQQNGGELYYNILDGVTWLGEQKVPDIQGATGSPGAVLFRGNIHCFYQGANADGKLWHNVLDTKTDTWRGEIQLALQEDEYLTLGPSPAGFRNCVYNLYNGADKEVTQSGRLRVNVFNGSGAILDMQVPNTYLTAEPSAVVFNGELHAFHQGDNSDGTVWVNTTREDSWDGDKPFPLAGGLLIQDGPSAMALEGKLYCFLRGRGNGSSDKLWYNVLAGSASEWGVQKILPTASGIGGQPDALAIGSLSIQYYVTRPAAVERVI